MDPTFVVSIVRSPLIYGPGVKGNIRAIMGLLQRQVPLPLAGIQNSRSMVGIKNLIALVEVLITRRATGTFVAGDIEPISTTELVTSIVNGMGVRPRLFALPRQFQTAAIRFMPRVGRRLFGSYVISNAETNLRLEFRPPHSTQSGLEEMGRWARFAGSSLR
jgi:UDP-glucose 4-epimerase